MLYSLGNLAIQLTMKQRDLCAVKMGFVAARQDENLSASLFLIFTSRSNRLQYLRVNSDRRSEHLDILFRM